MVSQVFLLKHMFPKALVLYFLCSDLLPLPYHMWEAQWRKDYRTAVLSSQPTCIRINALNNIHQVIQQWTNLSLISYLPSSKYADEKYIDNVRIMVNPEKAAVENWKNGVDTKSREQ